MNATPRECGAETRTDGTPCRRPCRPGFSRCNLHGAHSPLARQAAFETLARAALPGAEALFDIITNWQRNTCPACGMPNGDPSPVIRAAQIVLDRTGFGPHATMEVVPAPNAAISDATLSELADRAERIAIALRRAADDEAARRLPEAFDADDAVIVEGTDQEPGA